jgi:hypothetical protein
MSTIRLAILASSLTFVPVAHAGKPFSLRNCSSASTERPISTESKHSVSGLESRGISEWRFGDDRDFQKLIKNDY